MLGVRFQNLDQCRVQRDRHTGEMSKEHLEFDVDLPAEQVHELCRTVVAERRWFIDELGAGRLTVRTGQPGNVIKAV